MAQSDCNNTAKNPTELAEPDTHPIPKSNLRESGYESKPVRDNNGGVASIKTKSLVFNRP